MSTVADTICPFENQLPPVARRHRSVVIEIDVGRTGGLHKRDIGNIVPKAQRIGRDRLFGSSQVAEIVGDRVAIKMVRNAAFIFPVAVDQVVSKLRDSRDRLARVGWLTIDDSVGRFDRTPRSQGCTAGASASP